MGDRLATMTWAEKWEEAVALSVGETWAPSNTTSPGSRPTSVQSGIMIHPTLQTGQTAQRSHGIGRTVDCNGRQKYAEFDGHCRLWCTGAAEYLLSRVHTSSRLQLRLPTYLNWFDLQDGRSDRSRGCTGITLRRN